MIHLESLKQHIVFRSFAIVVLMAILTPSVVKVYHAFENHKHEVCLGEQKAHIHSLDLECEFYKFKVNNPFTVVFFNVEILLFKYQQKTIRSQYFFIGDHQHLSFSLRAPPQLV